MKYVHGNLLDLAEKGRYDLIVHGCNCFNNMGAGIAKEIKNRYPEAGRIDRESKFGYAGKLGSYTQVEVERASGDPLTIINAYTQYEYGGGKVNADYEAIESVFKQLSVTHRRKSVGIPLIGAGLAGGNWKVIHDIISFYEDELFVEVVIFDDNGLLTVLKSLHEEQFGDCKTVGELRFKLSKMSVDELSEMNLSPIMIKDILGIVEFNGE